MGFSLALGGGGAKGLAHIEFLKIIDELGIKPKEISGTSIGSVIGALYASGMTAKEIEQVAMKITKRTIVSFTDFTFNNKGLIKGKKLYSWLESLLKEKEFKDLKIPLKITVTNLTTGELEIISEGKIIDAIRASISIPGIFEPVTRNGCILVDGGVLDQVPYDCLKGNVIAIDVTYRAKVPKNISAYENLIYSFYTMRRHLDYYKKKPKVYIAPELNNVGVLEFHKYSEVKKAIHKDLVKFREKMKKVIN